MNTFKKMISFLICLTVSLISILPVHARNDEVLEDWKYVGTGTAWCAYKEAFNQPPNGTIFQAAGSSFGWSDSSQTRGTGSISVSINGTFVSVGISYTPGKVGGVTRNFAVPSNLLHKRVKLYIRRQYKVVRYAVYKYNKYSGKSTEKFSHYHNEKTILTEQGQVKAV